MILENGRVLTLDPGLPAMGALAVTRDGRIARGVEAWEGEPSAVSTSGSTSTAAASSPAWSTRTCTSSPGPWSARPSTSATATTLAACLAPSPAAQPAAPAGWIYGRGWVADRPDAQPTAAALDG